MLLPPCQALLPSFLAIMRKAKKSIACYHAMLLQDYLADLATKEQSADIWIFQQVITHVGNGRFT